MSSKSHAQRDLESKSLVESKSLHEGKILSLRLDTYQFDKRTKVIEIIHHPGAVAIIPVDQHNRIMLVQQWRRAAKEITIEIPAGTLDAKESPEECALRELREETGFSAGKITSLGGFYSAPGFCDEYIHLFAAEHLTSDPLPADEDEEIDLLHLSFSEAIHLIEQNKIRDAKTVAGILRYQLWRAASTEPLHP